MSNADLENATVPPSEEKSAVEPGKILPRRKLWLPAALVVLYWIAYFVFGYLDLPMFTRFLGRTAALLVVLLVFSIWWLVRGPARLRFRFLVLGWAVICGVIVTVLMHRSVLPPVIYFLALPGLLTAWTGWLLLTQIAFAPTRVIGLFVITVLVWTPGTLVRMEGLKGDGTGDFHWRWSPSAEELFLRNQPAKSTGAESSGEPLVAAAGDWPEFRGPNRDAVVPGVKLATDWDRTPPRQVWQTRVGPAWSSMVVVGDRLFTQEQRGNIEVASCYDANTGSQLWFHEDDGRFEENLGGVGPRATPTFADGRIYCLGAAGRLNCLDAVSGERIWTRDIVADASAKVPTWGFSASPLVVDDRVIVFAGGEAEKALVAYDASSGEIAWKAAASAESYSSPQLATIDGQQQILFVGNERLGAYDPSSGKQIWEFEPDQSFTRPVVQPRLIGDGQLLVSFVPDQGVTRLAVTATAASESWNVLPKWNSRNIKPDYSDFVHHDGYIYGFNGNFFCCVDIESGQRQWIGGRYGAGQVLLLADQPLLVVTTEQGEVVLVAANPNKPEELARFQAVSGKTWNHPVIAHGKLFVRNAEEMACYQLRLAE